MAQTQRVERPSGHGRSIGRAAFILMLGNLTGSALGFVRQDVIAKVFGATYHTDAFVAASVVPQMFYDLTIGAAVSAALIPTFTEILERQGKESLWRTLGSVVVLVWLVLAAVTGLLIAIARPIMTLILWGWHQHLRATDFNQAVEIARILIPSLFFLGTSAVILATLYTLRRFTAPAFAPSLYHLGIIGGAIFLARPLGILALPVGALVGSAAQAGLQLPVLLRQGAHLRLHFTLTPEIRHIVKLYAPVAAGLLVSIAGQIIDMNFKSHLPGGGISVMGFATTLTQFPIGIAVAAMSFAVLPSISSDAAFGRLDEFKDTLASGIRFVLFLTIPAATGYLALATPVVSLVFQHGHFTPYDTARTAAALTGYAIQIPFVGLDQLLIFAFYARKNTVTPMLIGIVGVGIYIASALLLMPRYGILGLALANTLQNSLHGIILLVLLFSSIGTLAGRHVAESLTKSVVAAAVMAVSAAGTAHALAGAVNTDLLAGQVADALIPIAIGAAVYLGVAGLLRARELADVWALACR